MHQTDQDLAAVNALEDIVIQKEVKQNLEYLDEYRMVILYGLTILLALLLYCKMNQKLKK